MPPQCLRNACSLKPNRRHRPALPLPRARKPCHHHEVRHALYIRSTSALYRHCIGSTSGGVQTVPRNSVTPFDQSFPMLCGCVPAHCLCARLHTCPCMFDACVHHMLWLGVAPAVALPGARRRCRHRTRRVHVYTHFYTHVYARVYAQVLDARMPLFHFNHSMFEYPPAHAHAHARAHASAIYTRLHTHPSWYSP